MAQRNMCFIGVPKGVWITSRPQSLPSLVLEKCKTFLWMYHANKPWLFISWMNDILFNVIAKCFCHKLSLLRRGVFLLCHNHSQIVMHCCLIMWEVMAHNIHEKIEFHALAPNQSVIIQFIKNRPQSWEPRFHCLFWSCIFTCII